MNTRIREIFPTAELLKSDPVEEQYMVTAEECSFWLSCPADSDLKERQFIFVFAGRGGSGKSNNITQSGPPEQFRKEMLQAGFAFICAVCSPDAWGDPESTEATLAAIGYCRKQGIKLPEKIDLLGFSMGGLGALMFAARHPEQVRKAADVFGITDLDDFYSKGNYQENLGKIPPAERQERSPCARVSCYRDMDLLIVHGDSDKIVDLSYSKRFYELLQAQKSSARLIIIPGAGHSNDILEQAGGSIQRFFES